MKYKQLLQMLLVVIASQVFFACGSAKYYDFGSGSTAYHKQKKTEVKPEAVSPENATATAEIATELPSTMPDGPTLEASAAETTPALPAKKFYEINAEEGTAATDKIAVSEDQTVFAPLAYPEMTNKVEKKKTKKGIFSGIKAIKATFVEVILAIFIPPLAVYLHEGEINNRFWISLVLTLLVWLPGVIYALLVVTDSI